ncbi:GDSL esterase/lipase EXL3 [Elaeis guineensis]|uniref:GDSL esterase/lipase EXL3 n=1 Tax=Elaeis guineensis var. tenera TaxID=51953 RepID=A0A6I9S8G5_ELAGV|nr:GDSL esterase/lipase EXL3 [Elaeis guineensis]
MNMFCNKKTSTEKQLSFLMGMYSVICFLFVTLPIIQSQALVPDQTAVRVPAVFAFGDSIDDPGNNNMLLTIAKSNFPPYGRDFIGHRATGRFSNGKIPTDFIASLLGVKELLPAYLDPDVKEQDLLTGVSFASGGAGYDNLTAELLSVFSLWDQLEMFEEYKRELQAIVGEDRAVDIVAEGVCIIFAGTDDLMNTYFTSSIRALSYDLPSYINFVLQAASSFLKELYNLGPRKIGVVGVPPIGCLPAQRTLRGGIARDCVDAYNQASIKFNSELSMEVERLATYHPGAKIVYIDVYNPLLELIMHPYDYGFEEVTKGCFDPGKIVGTILPNNLSQLTCPDATKYLFWDPDHPTEKGYQILVNKILPKLLYLLK